MIEIVWTHLARKAREAAIDYIAQDDVRAALRQLDEIEAQTDSLCVHPNIGRPGRVEGTRELVINHTPFIAVYRLNEAAQRVEILSFLHGAQQWPPANDEG